MDRRQLERALKIAGSDKDLSCFNLDIFDGYTLPEFDPVTVTIDDLAKLIRWQCFKLDGTIDSKELDDLAYVGKRKFKVMNVERTCKFQVKRRRS